MKKSIAIILSFVLIMAITLPSAAFKAIPVKGIKLDKSKIAMKVGQTYKLKVTLTPANTTQKSLTFVTGNKKIATIDAKGTIKGVGKGTTTVTVNTYNKKIFAKCNVTVSQPVEDTLFNKLGVIPLFKKKVKLTVGIPGYWKDEEYDGNTNLYTKLLQGKANVELDMKKIACANNNEHLQKIAIMVSSGSPLPEILIGNFQTSDINSYGSEGIFLPLNKYYKESSYYIKKYMDSGDSKWLPYISAPDGNIYGIPKYAPEVGNTWAYRGWINKTWLDNLGLKMPKTTDEYYNVLKAFKEKDPNKNNKADEIPLMDSIDGWNTKPQDAFLMNPFIYCNIGGVNNAFYLLVDNNGKISPAYNKPQWKAGLEYMHKLCSEGLLSPLTFTQNNTAFKQVLENVEVQLIGSFAAGSLSLYKNDSVRKRDMVPMPPLTGPEGANYATLVAQIPTQIYFITKYCKNPEAAFRLGDLMWDEELSISARFGMKGVHWDYYKGSEKGLYDSLGIPATINVIQNIWGQDTAKNVFWYDNGPARRTDAMGVNGQVWDGDKYSTAYMTAQAVPLYINKTPKEVIMSINYNKDEWNQISDISTSLETYVRESATRFIVGDMSLSNWDKYVKELETIGLNKYLEIAQKAYNRMMGRR